MLAYATLTASDALARERPIAYHLPVDRIGSRPLVGMPPTIEQVQEADGEPAPGSDRPGGGRTAPECAKEDAVERQELVRSLISFLVNRISTELSDAQGPKKVWAGRGTSTGPLPTLMSWRNSMRIRRSTGKAVSWRSRATAAWRVPEAHPDRTRERQRAPTRPARRGRQYGSARAG